MVVFDDQITSDVITKKKSSLTKFLTMGRHCNISVIFMLQQYKGNLSPVLRDNMNIVCIGNLSSQEQIEMILNCYSAHLGSNRREALGNLMKWYETAVSANDHRGYLCVHTYTPFGKGRFENQLGSGVFFDEGMVPSVRPKKKCDATQ